MFFIQQLGMLGLILLLRRWLLISTVFSALSHLCIATNEQVDFIPDGDSARGDRLIASYLNAQADAILDSVGEGTSLEERR